jgi:protein SCO1/2
LERARKVSLPSLTVGLLKSSEAKAAAGILVGRAVLSPPQSSGAFDTRRGEGDGGRTTAPYPAFHLKMTSRVRSENLRRVLLGSSIALLLFSLAGLVWLNLRLSGKNPGETGSSPPVLAELPDFQLTAQNGQSLGLADLKGKVWVADFIFTRCPGPCPRMTASMARLQRKFAEEASLRLVSFSVDPEFDTVAVLAQYALRFGADPQRWFFLTGEKAKIHTLAKSGFLVGGVEDVTLHTTWFILIDRQARVRGYYDSSDDESLQKLLVDARTLVRERET